MSDQEMTDAEKLRRVARHIYALPVSAADLLRWATLIGNDSIEGLKARAEAAEADNAALVAHLTCASGYLEDYTYPGSDVPDGDTRDMIANCNELLAAPHPGAALLDELKRLRAEA